MRAPLFFKRFLLAQPLDLPMEFVRGDQVHRGNDQREQQGRSPCHDHHVFQNGGSTVMARETPASFQTQSSLQAVTRNL